MRIRDFLAILIACLVTGLMLVAIVKILFAVAITLTLLVLGLSTLNYLNHGKFSPYIRRSS
jgi:hypothetical protein